MLNKNGKIAIQEHKDMLKQGIMRLLQEDKVAEYKMTMYPYKIMINLSLCKKSSIKIIHNLEF